MGCSCLAVSVATLVGQALLRLAGKSMTDTLE